MQRMLNRLNSWGKSKNLTFNPSKSVAVLFSKSRNRGKQYLQMDGEKIKHEEKVKYLGVTLDRALNWREHIKGKLGICKGLLINIINKYRHTPKAKPKLMKWIYTGVILSLIHI